MKSLRGLKSLKGLKGLRSLRPMVSVIIPTYNRDEPLRRTLESLFTQDDSNFEIIVVDQSDKKFPEKERFLKKYRRQIRLFSGLSPNVAAARNFGVKKAKGEILLFLDDDVECQPGLISAHRANYQNKKIGAVVGRIITVGQKEEPERRNVGRITPWGYHTGGFSSKIKQEIFDAITCNASWRREVFEKIGGFDENFSGPIREDSDLAIRTRERGYKIIFEPKAELVHLRAETGGFRKSEGRLKWYYGFFKSETYFCLKHIAWFWWPIFWLSRWQWFLRCMFGREVSLRSVVTPFWGIAAGVRDFRAVRDFRGLKIGIDAGCLGVTDERLKVGVYQVAFNLIREIGEIWEVLLYSFRAIPPEVMKEFGPKVRNIVVRPAFGWNYFALPLRLLKDKPDVFLGLSQSLPAFCPCPALVIIYDLAFEHYPECYPQSYDQLRRVTAHAAQKAQTIITLSLETKKDLIKFYRISPEKIKVVCGGYDAIFRPQQAQREAPYFLFVGALKPVKNIPRILEAYALFLKKTGKNIPFVFAGGDLWIDKEIEPTVARLGLKNKVKFLGYVSQKKLVSLYQGALAFVSPSLYEGFGLTLLEAMACGCPVIAGNSGSQPEVVGEAGILVNPKDVAAIAEAMIRLAKNPAVRRRLSAAGLKQAKNFSWEKFGGKIIGLIGRICPICREGR
ncbi:MAG: glycosyltransferase [Microgenomates group bacterium]